MWIFWVLGAGVLALFGYMALLDLRSRRRGRTLDAPGSEPHLGRLAAQAEFDRRNPGGAGHFPNDGFGANPGI
jgi:hypothetical protein